MRLRDLPVMPFLNRKFGLNEGDWIVMRHAGGVIQYSDAECGWCELMMGCRKFSLIEIV